MPTAARLVAGIVMAIFCVIVIMVAESVYPDMDRRLNAMMLTAGFVGFMVGWRSLGLLIPADEGSGMTSGFRSGFVAFMWVIGLFALNNMIEGMLSHAYYQPLTAVLQIPIWMIVYGKMAMNLKILGTMLGLSLLAGKMAKNASLRWDNTA